MRVTGYDQTIAEISGVERRVTRKKTLFQILERMVYSNIQIWSVKRPFFTNCAII